MQCEVVEELKVFQEAAPSFCVLTDSRDIIRPGAQRRRRLRWLRRQSEREEAEAAAGRAVARRQAQV